MSEVASDIKARPRRVESFVVEAAAAIRSFYSQPIAWLALLVSAVLLTYGGGAVMFWLHAIVRKEPGPAISPVHHWLLDSTLGFVALTPVLGLILPLGAWHAGGPGRRGRLRVYVAATAVVFTLVTGPGPLFHNMIAGSGTPLAELAARLFGKDESEAMHAAHAHPQSPLAEGLLQIGVGLPVYLVCTGASVMFVRSTARLARRRGRHQRAVRHR